MDLRKKQLSFSKRVLILCEDSKSSLEYLNAFKKDEKLKRELSSVMIEIYHPVDYSPMGLVREALQRQKISARERNKFDEIWIVLDKDQHANLKQAINLADEKKIQCALSIICFEIWYLLHFTKTSRPYDCCNDLIKDLKEFIPDYEKNLQYFDLLKDKMPEALKNGYWLEKQNQNEFDRGATICDLSAYTNVHHLVERLLNPEFFGKK